MLPRYLAAVLLFAAVLPASALGAVVGRVLRYRIRSGALPDVDFLCRAPGSKARGC